MKYIQEKEKNRVNFVKERDGVDAAIFFCKQGIVVYGNALKKPCSRRLEEEYKESIEFYNKFLKEN